MRKLKNNKKSKGIKHISKIRSGLKYKKMKIQKRIKYIQNEDKKKKKKKIKGQYLVEMNYYYH